MRLLLSAFVFLLGVTAAQAQYTCPTATPGTSNTQCASTAFVQAAVATIPTLGWANAIGFGADPSGVADSTTAIANALVSTQFSQNVDVFLPPGTYYLTNSITLSSGQCLVGAGRGLSTLSVDSHFNVTATGVILLTGREQQSPCVMDLAFSFAQPQGQGTRSNFKTLAAGCSTGGGGSGCKYPPAINSTTANRFRLERLSFYAAWDGIKATASGGNAAGGWWINDIEMGALDVGLAFDNGLDFCHIKGWHSWNFGISSTLLTGVYEDGNTVAGSFGECDEISIVDFDTFAGNINITSNWSFGSIANLMLDTGATLSIAGGQSLLISNVTATGVAPGGTAQIVQISGNTFISNVNLKNSTTNAVNMSGGVLNINGGQINPVTKTVGAVVQSGGQMQISNVWFAVFTAAGTWTTPIVNNTAGFTQFYGNTFQPATATETALSIATDNTLNAVVGNNFNGWTFTPPGLLGAYGIIPQSNEVYASSNNKLALGNVTNGTGLNVTGTASSASVDDLKIIGAPTGTNAITMAAEGTDTNVGIAMAGQGTGSYFWNSSGSGTIFEVTGSSGTMTAGALVTGGTGAGGGATISKIGTGTGGLTINSDANGPLLLQANATSFVSVATTGAATLFNQPTTGAITYAVCAAANANGATGGALILDTSGTVCGLSSKRFKNIIGSISEQEALLGLGKLHAGVWKYKDTKNMDDDIHVSLYAEDVEKMDPRCVLREPDGKARNYEDRCVVAYLATNIQRMQRELVALKKQVKH